MTEDLEQLAAYEWGLFVSLLVDSLAFFVETFWPEVAPGRPYVRTIASEAVIEHLEALAFGRLPHGKLAISIAPGSGKSSLAVLFRAWLFLRRPESRSIFASHAHSLAVRDSMRVRRLIEGELFRRVVANRWRLRDDANRADYFETTGGGHSVSLGVGGALTGIRAGSGGVIGIDDSLNAVDARSKATRETVNSWFDNAVTTRWDEDVLGVGGGILVMQQRLHSGDLIGHVLELGGFESLVLASEFDSARRCVTSIWQDPRTTDNELLAPAIHSAEFLADQKRILGTAGYACQYLATPSDEEGGLFPRGAWRFWKPDGTAPDCSRRPRGCSDAPAVPLPDKGLTVVSLDAAFKDLATSDAVCFLVSRIVGAERYILERRYGRMSFTKTCDTLEDLARKYPGATFLCEDKANGSAIVDALRRKVSNLLAIEPDGGKEARAAACSPAVEAHQVLLPDGADWLGDFIEECAAFPKGKHDDQVDALTQLLNWAARRQDHSDDRAVAGALITDEGIQWGGSRGFMSHEERRSYCQLGGCVGVGVYIAGDD